MYIAEIELQDLRSYEGTHTISLDRGDGHYAGWTVFAGRNGAGKSTLLKSLAIAVIGPLAARSLVSTFPGWVRNGKKRACVKTCLYMDKNYDNFQRAGNTTTRNTLWTGVEWMFNGSSSDQIQAAQAEPSTNRPSGLLRGPWAEAPKGWFIVGYGPYRHLGPATAEVLKKSVNPVLSRLINLFDETATLSESVDWLISQHLRAFERRPGAEELKTGVLRFLGDGLLPDGSTVDGVDSEGLWIRRDGIRLPLDQVSDGYRTVAALVVGLLHRLHVTYRELPLEEKDGHLTCTLPGVVLIDEVEAHMHVSWQQKIGIWLTSRFPNIQFLVTTHSPFICQAASPRGLIRLPAPGSKERIQHIEGPIFNAIVNGSADDAAMSVLFGLEYAHSEQSERMREEVATLENKVLRGTASGAERARYVDLKRQLPDGLEQDADVALRALHQRIGRP